MPPKDVLPCRASSGPDALQEPDLEGRLRVLPAKSGTPSCVGLELTITDLGDASEFFRSVRELDYVVMAVPVSR